MTACAIIPTYNRAKYIEACIDSLLAQSHKLAQIIVVNDGSTDNTLAVLEKYGDAITIITKPNGGKASALNLGMQHVTAEYVWVCDDDDIAAPDGLKALITLLNSNSDIDIAYGRYLMFQDGDTLDKCEASDYWSRPEEANPKINFLEGMFTNQFAMLTRKSLYDKTGPFNEKMIRSQDFEMTTRLMRYGKAAPVDAVIFYYRQHAGERGSAADRFSSASNSKKWLKYEGMVVAEIRANYALEEFCPTFALALEPALKLRACYLERALISANRAMWSEALADLTQAAAASPAAITTEEKNLAFNVIRTTLPWYEIKADPQFIKDLRIVFSASAYGRTAILCMMRPLLWELRRHISTHEFSKAVASLKLIISILGPIDTLTLLRRKY